MTLGEGVQGHDTDDERRRIKLYPESSLTSAAQRDCHVSGRTVALKVAACINQISSDFVARHLALCEKLSVRSVRSTSAGSTRSAAGSDADTRASVALAHANQLATNGKIDSQRLLSVASVSSEPNNQICLLVIELMELRQIHI